MNESERLYKQYKPLLFGLAYRMLGSAADAEDIVQEAFLHWSEAEPRHVANEKAYLCKVVTNKSIDRLRSASRQREAYVGPWLPEPLLTEGGAGETPSEIYLHKESLSTAYMLLLQQLTWSERAVFVLREVLQYEYDEIADIVDKSPANCRQIFSRAKRAIGARAEETEPAVPAASFAEVVEPFVQALLSGNTMRMLQLLKADAKLYSDGGGKVTAAVKPILGADRIIAFLTGVISKLPVDYRFRVASVNGGLGVISYEGDTATVVATFRIEGDKVTDVYLQANPDKLSAVR